MTFSNANTKIETKFDNEHPMSPASTSRSPHGTSVQMDGIHTMAQDTADSQSSDIAAAKITYTV
jgi:hypothetical protein